MKVGLGLAPLVSIFKALRGRLVLLVSLSTVPALLFAFVVSARERTATIERLEVEARHVGRLASREHLLQIAGAKALLFRLRRVLACDGASPSSRREFLRALQASNPQFANIGVLSATGVLEYSAATTSRGLDMAWIPAFKQALGSKDVVIGTYAIGPIVRRPVMYLADAIRQGNGEPCGVAFVALDLRWLDSFASQAALPSDYALLVADRSGAVQAGGGYAWPSPGTQLSTMRLPADLVVREAGMAVTFGSPSVARFVVSTRLDGAAGPNGVGLGDGGKAQAETVGGAIRGLDDLYVIAGLPYERLRGEANWTFYRTLIAFAAITFLTLACALLAAEISVLRVLRSLGASARSLEAGDLTARAPLPTDESELQDLAISFNRMADALAARQREADDSRAQLRALSHRLRTTRDVEAGRIARELHDELGQVLTSLKIDLSRMKRACAETPHQSCAIELGRCGTELGERVDAALDFVRRLASELRPSVLDRLGLAAALEWLTHEFDTKTGVAIFLRVRDGDRPIADAVATVLFRIVQEALTNVARHAEATEVHIDLAGDADALVLSIRDDGKGFDPGRAGDSHSLGILNMQERAQLVGGTWHMASAPGEGTAIVVAIPHAIADGG